MTMASPAFSMLTLFRPSGFLPHSLYSGSHTYHCPCISCKQLSQAATSSVNRFSNMYKERGFYILRLTCGLGEFKLHGGDKHDKFCRLKQYEHYREDSMFLASTLHCPAERWQPHGVEGHLSSCSSSNYTNVSDDEPLMRLTDQYFPALVGRKCFISLASVYLGTLLTASGPSALAVTVRERKLSSYNEQRLLEQNKRIQNANGAPSNFPNFIREGFNVKVVTPDNYVRCDSGLIYWDIKEGEGDYPKSGQQAQGRRVPNWQVDGNLTISSNRSSILKPETVDVDFDIDINRWLRSSRVVQWYPGHIAKAEKELKQQLKLMDVVIEVRDARIPMATGHPEMDSWIGTKKKILVLNRVDMVSTADKNAWATYFSRQGLTVVLANGQLGMGTMKLARVAKSLASNVNDKRRAKGLLPRAIRAGVVGYPNVGKSSLINRLLKRRICEAAPRPGVTRVLKWVRIGQDLDLLDSPGILPMQFSDQAAATKLAICDDIGERSYDIDGVAAVLIEILKRLPTAGATVLQKRYKIDADDCCGEAYVKALGQRLFKGDVNQAAYRILHDFRKGKFGWIALERSP